MIIERISLRFITVTILLLLGLLPLAHTIVAKMQFRDAALDAIASTLSRVIAVAGEEMVRDMELHTLEYAFAFARRTDLGDALAALAGDDSRLVAVLDDPFDKGFVGAAFIDLVKLRVYDPNLELVGQSSQGGQVSGRMPDFLHRQASKRAGAERLKGLTGLWSAGTASYHSTLVPIGGLRLKGYLEVVINPEYNLPAIAMITHMPIQIHAVDDREVFSTEDPVRPDDESLLVEYVMIGSDGLPAFHVTAREDLDSFYTDMHNTQLLHTALFVTVTLLTVLVALILLRRYLFRPVDAMVHDVERIAEGVMDARVDTRGLMELHRLGKAFNTMARKVQQRTGELQKLSLVDALTGIANRRSFDEVLEREWARAGRDGSPLSVVMIDIDFFKQFNDTYGHSAGDDCIRAVGQAIAQVRRRPGDLAARYGGEEFSLILPDTAAEGVATVADELLRLIDRLAIPHANSRVADHVTVSIGCATLKPSQGLGPERLVMLADAALYQAKRSGRHRIETASDCQQAGDSSAG